MRWSYAIDMSRWWSSSSLLTLAVSEVSTSAHCSTFFLDFGDLYYIYIVACPSDNGRHSKFNANVKRILGPDYLYLLAVALPSQLYSNSVKLHSPLLVGLTRQASDSKY